MVFKFATFDLTEDINATFPYTLPSSPEPTNCISLGDSCTRPIRSSSCSLCLSALRGPWTRPCSSGEKKPKELPFITSEPEDITDLQFPNQKQLRSFTYQELETATDHFVEKNIVDQDHHSGLYTVYRGRFPSGYVFSVKRFDRASFRDAVQFKAGVLESKLVVHGDLLPLIGFSEITGSGQIFLVYPFMDNDIAGSSCFSRSCFCEMCLLSGYHYPGRDLFAEGRRCIWAQAD